MRSHPCHVPAPCALVFAAMALASFVGGAQAVPQHVDFVPASTEVSFRAYGLGLLPIDGSFTRFSGRLEFDPGDPTFCRAELRVQVASLVTEDPAMRETVVGPDFMDAGSFPSLTYSGTCDRDGMGGLLAMHGQTHPFVLSLNWSAQRVVAEGRLERAEWGMAALPVLGGRTVRIRVTVSLPA